MDLDELYRLAARSAQKVSTHARWLRRELVDLRDRELRHTILLRAAAKRHALDGVRDVAPKCSNCVFYQSGECRIRAPIARHGSVKALWPATNPDSGCGEWKGRSWRSDRR